MSRSTSIIASVILSAILVGLLGMGMWNADLDEFAWLGIAGNGGKRYLLLAYLTMSFLMLTLLFSAVFYRGSETLAKAQNADTSRRPRLSFSKRSVVIATLVIFACWIPWTIIQFPIGFSNDTYVQLIQFRTPAPTLYTTTGAMFDAEFIDHHPVFDTFVFGLVLEFGDLVGSQNAGLYVFSLLQCALISFTLAFSCCYLEKLSVPQRVRMALLVISALFPLFPQFATSMTKDTFHVSFFILFSIGCIEIVRSKGKAWEQTSFIVFIIVTASLCILTKKTGVFIVIGSLIVLLLLYGRKHILKAAGSTLAPVLICCIAFPVIVYPLVGGVEPGGRQEAFGAILQQVATAARENPEGITESEREAIEGVIDLEKALGRFDEENVDPVKNSFRQSCDTSDVLRFIPAYISVGVKHPVEYLTSLGKIALYLVAPIEPISYFNSCENAYMKKNSEFFENVRKAEEDPGFTFSRPKEINALNKNIRSGFQDFATSVPFIGWPLTKGFYGGWIPLACLFTMMLSSRRKAVALVPFAIAFAFLVLSPISSSRYVVPFLYAVPLFIGLMCWALEDAIAHKRGQSPFMS